MIKNKDGSYNIFRILIISLIFIIGISITGIYINKNIELPKIEIPQLPISTPTPTPTPIPTLNFSNSENPTRYYSNWSIQFNESQSPDSWNWSYTNYYTNTSSFNISYVTYSNWTYPQNINSTRSIYIAGGGGGGMTSNISGGIGYGGQGGYGYYNATTYQIVVGGGGSGGSYSIDGAGIYHTIETTAIQTPTPTPTQMLEPNMTLILSPFSQDPSINLIWIILPITTVIFMTMIMGNRSTSIIPMLITLSLIGVFLFHNWFITITSISICIFIVSFEWLRDKDI